MKALPCAFALLLVGIGLAQESSAEGARPQQDAKASTTQTIDVELPTSEPLAAQWIVVVQDGEIQILPASEQPFADGIVVSARHPTGDSELLSAAVVTTKTGATLTTPLKLAK
jgi:hypothetical protein